MEESSEAVPRAKRVRLVAEDVENAPSYSQTQNEALTRCTVDHSTGGVPEVGRETKHILNNHVVSHTVSVRRVECRNAWASTLSKQQKHYGHYFSLAAWAGARVCAFQSSQESPAIMRLLCLLFSGEPVTNFKERCLAAGITEREWRFFGAFASCFFTNMGNYLAFGGLKIVPGITKKKLSVIINSCTLQGDRKQKLLEIWNTTKDKIYSLEEDERYLGLPPHGTSMYYHPRVDRKDIDLVQEWMAHHGLEGLNTRIWRRDDELERDGLPVFQLQTASSIRLPTEVYNYKDRCIIEVVYGDFQVEMKEVVQHLLEALAFTSAGHQRDMVEQFIVYFETGSIEAHKQSQKHWLAQKDSCLETNIGFMETYRDPNGTRAEFEGFFATVDKDKSEKYARLVAAAEELLKTLPWPKDFEKDVFIVPQFSSLDMISFANSSIPAGINLPNYEDVRQESGFKNVVLGNIFQAHEDVGKVTFLKGGDLEIFEKLMHASNHVQTACHEFLGHGSGKILRQYEDGSYNYRHGEIIHPFTSEPLVECYAPGQTFEIVFGSLSLPLEECRADCIGMFLSTNALVLEIFGHTATEAEDVVYVNWLIMIRAGLVALEFFNPETRKWRESHMQARFAILRVLLNASEAESEQANLADVLHPSPTPPFIQLDIHETDVFISLERSKLRSVGLPALSCFMSRLQVYKSTADVKSAHSLFTEICNVSEYFLALRRVVLVRSWPRPLLVQVNTVIDESCEDGIRMIEYPPTFEGIIESFIDRYREWMRTF